MLKRNSGKYLAVTLGVTGVRTTISDSMKLLLKKAAIHKTDIDGVDFKLYSIRGNKIARITRTGKERYNA